MHIHENGRYRDRELVLANHTYRGQSVGSEGTCHQFPGYGVMFDVGVASLSSTAIPRVFVTHGHGDHVQGFVKHALRRDIRGLSPAAYYAQEEDAPLIEEMHRVQLKLARVRNPEPVRVSPIGVGSEVPVDGNLVLRPFRAVHRVPTLGYALWSRRRKLLAEHVGKPGKEIARLRAEGVAIDEALEVPEVAYCGDTSIRILETDAGDVVRRARLLLLECTFVDDESSPKDTFRTGHVHIEHVLDAAAQGAFDGNEAVLLTHFSARYSPARAREEATRRLRGTALEGKVHLLLPEERR